MARWKLGESEVEALIASGDLQKLTGDAANGELLLEKAAVTLETARSVIERDPDSASVLSYDAARQAVTALLAHQGLRPTTKGGPAAVGLVSQWYRNTEAVEYHANAAGDKEVGVSGVQIGRLLAPVRLPRRDLDPRHATPLRGRHPALRADGCRPHRSRAP